MDLIDIFVETGQKRVFTGAVDWPGWCRSARDEPSAQQTLLDYAPRYARVLHSAGIDFQVPSDAAKLTIVERHPGNSTTDFGAPAIILDSDSAPLELDEIHRLRQILEACWQALDLAVRSAAGKELRKGPRGGGRECDAIVSHVNGADQGYLSRLAWKVASGSEDPFDEQARTRRSILLALEAAAVGELPEHGSRGGSLWPLRYFIRRSAWHVLDHAWEIEDRIL